MSTELTRVTAALEALGDDATPEAIAELAHLYSLRDVVAAMFSITDGGGGGGGGSQPEQAFSLTAQQIKDSTLTPHTIIPAQGAGTLVIPTMYAWNFNAGATPFSGDVIDLVYGDTDLNVVFVGLTGPDLVGWTVGPFAGGAFVGFSEIGDPADYLNQPVGLQASSLRGPIAASVLGSSPGATGYVVGDTGTVDDGSPNATYIVTAADVGVPSAFTITDGGDGYLLGPSGAATEWTTTPGGAQPGGGSGLTIYVTSVDASGSAGDGTLSGIVYYAVADLS